MGAVRYAASRRKRARAGVAAAAAAMEWWRRVLVFPVKRVCVGVAARVRSRKAGGGLLKLHNDIETCGYNDVQVMWEILRRSEIEMTHASRRKRPFWRMCYLTGAQLAVAK